MTQRCPSFKSLAASIAAQTLAPLLPPEKEMMNSFTLQDYDKEMIGFSSSHRTITLLLALNVEPL